MATNEETTEGRLESSEETESSKEASFLHVSLLAKLKQTAAAVSDRVKTVALLYGGLSGEREVSIASGTCVCEILQEEGFNVIFIDTGHPTFLQELLDSKADVVFIALHGKGGEDGCIQGLLEMLNFPYTHSGVESSALAMDKQVSKLLYRIQQLETAAWTVVRKDRFSAQTDLDSLLATVGLPCVVKPVRDGSSLGVSIPQTREEFLPALEEGFRVGDDLLVEEFVQGVEVTVPVLGNTEGELIALPVIEIVPKNEFYDYESKYTEGGSIHLIPARISPEEREHCQQAAVKAHLALGCRGVSRTDMIVEADGTPSLIETNTIPGMTHTSLIPEAARQAGISNGELYRLLLHYALEN